MTHILHDYIRISLPNVDRSTDQIPRSVHLNFLTADDIIRCSEKQYVAARRMENLHIMEIKGTFESDWYVDLLGQPDCFWLHFQFIGHSERDSLPHTALSTSEYSGFYSMLDAHKIRLKAGRTSMVLLGVQLPHTPKFTSEWPRLAKPITADQPYFSSIHIGYRIKQIFEKIQQCKDTAYSLQRNMHYHFCQLIDVYHQDLNDKDRSLHKEDIVIYHQAIDDIVEHYMDEDMNIDTIAERIHVSSRRLYRTFQDKHTSVHKAIQTIRLHKGREMLRETNISVDGIAFQLNFSTAHYFYKQFVQQFGHSPTKERAMYRKSKKKKKH